MRRFIITYSVLLMLTLLFFANFWYFIRQTAVPKKHQGGLQTSKSGYHSKSRFPTDGSSSIFIREEKPTGILSTGTSSPSLVKPNLIAQSNGEKTIIVQTKEHKHWWFSPNTDDLTVIQWFQRLVAVKAAYFHPVPHHVVFVGLSSERVFLDERQNNSDQWCMFHDHSMEYMYRAELKFYSNYMWFCSVRKEQILPYSVYLTPKDPGTLEKALKRWGKTNTTVEQWALEINYLRPNDKLIPNSIAMCAGLMFRSQNILLLLQFFEFYLHHGVTHFRLHHFESIPVLSQLIIDYYRRKNVYITLTEIESDFEFCSYRRTNRKHPYCAQIMQDNYCVLQTAYKYEFVILCDFDELIQPVDFSQTLQNWLSVMKPVYDHVGAFKIMPRYRLTKARLDPLKAFLNNLTEYFTMNYPLMTWLNVSKPVTQLHYCPKLIVKPETVMDTSVHHVNAFYGNYANFKVDAYNQVFMHHFKNYSTMRPYWANNIPGHLYKMEQPYNLCPIELIEKIKLNSIQVLENCVRNLINLELTDHINE